MLQPRDALGQPVVALEVECAEELPLQLEVLRSAVQSILPGGDQLTGAIWIGAWSGRVLGAPLPQDLGALDQLDG